LDPLVCVELFNDSDGGGGGGGSQIKTKSAAARNWATIQRRIVKDCLSCGCERDEVDLPECATSAKKNKSRNLDPLIRFFCHPQSLLMRVSLTQRRTHIRFLSFLQRRYLLQPRLLS